MPQLVWFITGCSSGLGLQLVNTILSRGDKVIATARNIEKIQHLETQGATVLQLDVTADKESIDRAVQSALGVYGRIDVLVNNAGCVAIGLVEEVPYALPCL